MASYKNILNQRVVSKYDCMSMLLKSDFIFLKDGDWSDLTGTGVTVESTTLRDGGTVRSPIIGDILATHHTDPQVCFAKCRYSFLTNVCEN